MHNHNNDGADGVPSKAASAAGKRGRKTKPPARTLLIHIGSQKTGSSSIQHFLRQNAGEARRRGINFVKATRGWIDHNRLARELRSGSDETPLLAEVVAEMASSEEPTQIISAEEMFHPRAANRLAGLLPEEWRGNVKVIAYLRRPDDLMEALYKQRVKTGAIEPGPMRYLRDAAHEYDYLGALGAWERMVGRENMIVRPYRRDLLEGGDGVRDFLKATGLDELAEMPCDRPEDNPSFSAPLSELMGVFSKGGGNSIKLNEAIAGLNRPELKRKGDVYDADQRRTLLESLGNDFDTLCATYGEHLRPVLSMPDFTAEANRVYPTWRDWAELYREAGRAMVEAMQLMNSKTG